MILLTFSYDEMQRQSGFQYEQVRIALRGADFDWQHTAWKASATDQSPLATATEKAQHTPSQDSNYPLLKKVHFSVKGGQLLGICGEVCLQSSIQYVS